MRWRKLVAAHTLPPSTMKGISREVVPYEVDGLLDEQGQTVQVFREHGEGLDLYLDLGRIDANKSESVRRVLRQALAALEQQETR